MLEDVKKLAIDKQIVRLSSQSPNAVQDPLVVSATQIGNDPKNI